jgi:flagellar biosynthesis component FlhA
MPFALVFIGLVMIVTGAKGTQSALGRQLVTDFTGQGNFFYWFAAIGTLGALGSIPGFKPFSRMFMTLIIVAMVLRNGGVFDKFMQAIKEGPVSPSKGSTEKTASNMVLQGAANLSNTARNAISATENFRQSTTQPQSNPWENFKTTIGLARMFL